MQIHRAAGKRPDVLVFSVDVTRPDVVVFSVDVKRPDVVVFSVGVTSGPPAVVVVLIVTVTVRSAVRVWPLMLLLAAHETQVCRVERRIVVELESLVGRIASKSRLHLRTRIGGPANARRRIPSRRAVDPRGRARPELEVHVRLRRGHRDDTAFARSGNANVARCDCTRNANER